MEIIHITHSIWLQKNENNAHKAWHFYFKTQVIFFIDKETNVILGEEVAKSFLSTFKQNNSKEQLFIQRSVLALLLCKCPTKCHSMSSGSCTRTRAIQIQSHKPQISPSNQSNAPPQTHESNSNEPIKSSNQPYEHESQSQQNRRTEHNQKLIGAL